MRIDARQLQTFIAVAETGSLTRAAERVHLTQPALSMQLRAMQEALGVALFSRTGRGLRLTAAGEQLLPHARAAADAFELFEQAAHGFEAAPVGHLAIGTILDPDFIRLGDFLRALTAGAAGLATELRHGISGWVLREVREQRLDVGFYLGEADPALIRRRVLAPVRYLVVAPRGWEKRVAGRDWAGLGTLPWVWTRPESVHNRLLTPLFQAARASPQRVALVDQEASMLDLVKAGVGLSLLRETVALRESHETGLVVLRDRAVETELSLIALAARADEAPVRAAFQAADSVWGRVPG